MKLITHKLLALICIGIFLTLSAQAQQINWTAFEDLNDSLRKDRKPVMIFVHTDWCKFCKMQDNNTFSDPLVASLLNQHFYCLRLDAEDKREIQFLNRHYRFKPSGAGTGYHQLAEFLAMQNGDMSFPTTVFLSKDFQPVKQLKGFYRASELQRIVAELVK